MKILSANQIKQLDKETLKEQGIVSIELMERAAVTFVDWFMQAYEDRDVPIQIVCGTGNNGGDGLAVARLLNYLKYEKVEVFVVPISSSRSRDFQINYQQLEGLPIPITDIDETSALPSFPYGSIVIDAILGSGLNRPIDGFLEEVIQHINAEGDTIISIDIASGLFADMPTTSSSIHPAQTFSFELPKLAFMFSENYHRVGKWVVGDIYLSEDTLLKLPTTHYYIQKEDIQQFFRSRPKFAHKGSFGRSLLIVGSYGMMGAAILATRACLRSGSGLVTVHIPESGYEIIQVAIPEAIVNIDKDRYVFTSKPDTSGFNAIGVGCGLSKQETTFPALLQLLKEAQEPMVLDADALNIIATKEWLKYLPKGSIITPHVGEFERLFGKTDNEFERNALQCQKSKELEITIVLKGGHTAVTTPQGDCFFNSTGNPGMATAGSGDVLTGVITALLAQNYEPEEAAILGVYVHGLAGDIASKTIGQYGMLASDLIDHLGKAFLEIEAQVPL